MRSSLWRRRLAGVLHCVEIGKIAGETPAPQNSGLPPVWLGRRSEKTLPLVRDQRRWLRNYLQDYLEKLAMAAASVGKTSNTVTSLVTCRIS
jgi:hypothetical protein